MKPNFIILIKELWYDCMENRNSYGYDNLGFVDTIEEAAKIVEEGGRISKDKHWAFTKDMPLYKYTQIPRI